MAPRRVLGEASLDLGRQDPVTEVIRAVGPNLVVALLMDGPQLRERWGARYASVLAEDPGSSVLVLTSRGAARLSQPREQRTARGAVVASWRDVTGGVTEIELPDDGDAILLNLVCRGREEWSADGRSDGHCAYFPILTKHIVLKTGA